jgi:hypothetical protein
MEILSVNGYTFIRSNQEQLWKMQLIGRILWPQKSLRKQVSLPPFGIYF